MLGVRKIVVQILFSGIALTYAGCRQEADKQHSNTPEVKKSGGGPGAVFLDKKKEIPPRLEWNTNMTSKNGGEFSFRIASQGPFAVTIVNDAGYQALKNKKAFNKSDVLLTVDSKESTYEGKVVAPPGNSWFIIENHADKAVEFHLKCMAP